MPDDGGDGDDAEAEAEEGNAKKDLLRRACLAWLGFALLGWCVDAAYRPLCVVVGSARVCGFIGSVYGWLNRVGRTSFSHFL